MCANTRVLYCGNSHTCVRVNKTTFLPTFTIICERVIIFRMDSSNRNLLIITGALAVLAVAMSLGAHWLSRFPGDLQFTLLFQSIHRNLLLSLMKWASYIAEGWRSVCIVVVGSIIVWWRVGKLGALLVVSAGLSTLLVSVIKTLVGRPRPSSDLVHVWIVENSNGFPSGHAFYAMVVFGLMAYFAFTYIRKPGLRTLIFVSLVVLVVLRGASRVYLGVHWPSDVLGGYLYGAVFLGIFIWIDRKLGRRFNHIPIPGYPHLNQTN